ncbi:MULTISPECIES: hypothetical protein [Bacteroides]|uniref:hypothetical protein n=1 Tax=Bacteroides TaxID=816 RepID=UPI000B376D4E|nr:MULTISPECIES: hypothetical protein [Bacteroides]MBM6944234.1 hypothetical protein [Bacteroides gallinaceum]OUO57907.1 hypothetical protein B5F78_07610 [Bacteroides sp. An279]
MGKMITDIGLLPKERQEAIRRDIENRILPQARNVFENTQEKFPEYIKSEIGKAVQSMNKMINESQREGAIMLNISEVYVFNKERIRALKALEEELLGRNAMDLQQDRPKQQQKNQPARSKGRPKETLKDRMINDADGSKLQKIHKVMDGKKGKDVALIILACMQIGWMLKPTSTQVKEEFGDIGALQGFNDYINNSEEKFAKCEIEGVINSLLN